MDDPEEYDPTAVIYKRDILLRDDINNFTSFTLNYATATNWSDQPLPPDLCQFLMDTEYAERGEWAEAIVLKLLGLEDAVARAPVDGGKSTGTVPHQFGFIKSPYVEVKYGEGASRTLPKHQRYVLWHNHGYVIWGKPLKDEKGVLTGFSYKVQPVTTKSGPLL